MSSSTAKTFTVGWICALNHELAASRAMLDEEFAKPKDVDSNDDNVYIAGRIHDHHVIMACLGRIGKVSAATVAANMLRSFPSIRFGLMVGIGGAVPDKEDIRLGDVVVSESTGQHGGVIQYDMGKCWPDGFEVRGHLNKAPPVLLNAMSRLRAFHEAESSEMLGYMEAGLTKFPKMRQQYGYPGIEHDVLYRNECLHRRRPDCTKCRAPEIVDRPPRKDWAGNNDIQPRIFYGLIGSGDRSIASGVQRQKLASSAGILCFEMEAAGLVDSFPCLVIRGMSDYADAFKRDQWQRYAALTSAAYAKELLGHTRAVDTIDIENAANAANVQASDAFGQMAVHGGPVFQHTISGFTSNAPDSSLRFHKLENFVSTVPDRKTRTFIERPGLRQRIEQELHTGLRAGAKATRSLVVVVCGFGGVGKTQLVLHHIENHKSDYKGIFWLDARSKISVERDIVVLYRILFRLSTSAEIPPIAEVLVRMHAWFSAQTGEQDKYLLVFDNADKIADLKDPESVDLASLIPADPSVHVLVTTRIANVSGITGTRPIQVGSLEDDEALDLFWTNSGLERQKLSVENQRIAKEIIEEIGYLALAVELAAATISTERAMQDDLSLYLCEYRANRRELLERRPEWTTKYTENILSAWEATHCCLARRSPLAAKLLSFLALLDPTYISLDFFSLFFCNGERSNNAVENNQDWQSMWGDILGEENEGTTLRHIDVALTSLESFSLLRYDDHSKSYSMHKLVHDWCLQRLEVTKQVKQCRSVVQIIANKLPCLREDLDDDFQVVRHLKQSANAAISMRNFMSVNDVHEIIHGLEKYKTFVDSHQRFNVCEVIQRFILSEIRDVYGFGHSKTLDATYNLALILEQLHRYEEAAELVEEVRSKCACALEVESAFKIPSTNLLARIYASQGKLEQSARMTEGLLKDLRQSPAIDADVFYEIRRATLNLAFIAVRKAQFLKAESICTDFLNHFTPHERLTDGIALETARVLGYALFHQGRFDDAARLYEMALENCIRTYRRKTEYTFLLMKDLALILVQQGKLGEAEKAADAALQVGQEVLGEQHCRVLIIQELIQDIRERKERL